MQAVCVGVWGGGRLVLRWDVVGGSLGGRSLGSELRGTLLGLCIIAMNDSEFMNEILCSKG